MYKIQTAHKDIEPFDIVVGILVVLFFVATIIQTNVRGKRNDETSHQKDGTEEVVPKHEQRYKQDKYDYEE